MMSQMKPTQGQPHPVVPPSDKPMGKTSTLEIVSQDEQFQNLSSLDPKVDCQNQSKTNLVLEEETEGVEMSLTGMLLSQDVTGDGWCPEGNEDRSVGDSPVIKHPADEASHVSLRGSLRSVNLERDTRKVADCRDGNKREVEVVQGRLKDMHVGDIRGQAKPVIRKEDKGPADQRKQQCGSVNVGVSERLGHDPTAASGPKPPEAVPLNETTKIGDGGGQEAEAALFSTQSSDGCQQSLHQTNPNRQPGDNSIRSLHSSHSEPSMTTSQYPPPSASSYARSQSLQTSRRNEHYDLLLIYTKEDESTCADNFRWYAASKDWKVTSSAELPIGPLSLGNFRKAMECCSYVVLLISSHFISDKACERHYNIAIQYGDRHPEFTDCVLPIVFDSADLPPELDAIQHVTWGNQYFDNVMTKSVDVQKRFDRELREAAAVTFSPPNRAISVDAGISTCMTSSLQMASTSTLSTVPARIPLHGSESYQTIAPIQQPPRVPEQEACLMPSDNQSPVLPPIPVAAASDVGGTQSLHHSVAATTAGNPPHHAATSSNQLRAGPGHFSHVKTECGSKPPHPPLPAATSQQQATYQQQVNMAATHYHPSQHSEAVASLPKPNSGVTTVPHNTQVFSAQQPHQHLTHLLPTSCQPQATYQQQATQYQQLQYPEAIANISQLSSGAMAAQPSSQITPPHQPQATYQQQANVTATQYQSSQHPEAGACILQQSMPMASQPSTPVIPAQIQRTISHPAQDYANMTGEEIFRSLSPGLNPGQAASQMLSVTRFGKICELLDATDIRGHDWRLLAEILDLTHPQIRILEQNPAGATRALLEVFFLKNGTEGKVEVLEILREYFRNMERHDAAEHVDKEIMIAKCKRR